MTVDEALRELAGADVVAFGPVGFAAAVLPATRAYQTVADAIEDGAGVRPRLERLLAEATPAGRAYAATLLGRLDPGAGRAAWRTLATDPAEITTFMGCVMNRESLGAYAGARL
jgi:hypothetical protein